MIKQIIDKHLDANIFQYNFADLKSLLPLKYKDYHYGISILRKLDDSIIDRLSEGPTMKYYNHYNEVNMELSNKLAELEKDLEGKGIDCIGIKPTYHDSELNENYYKTLRTEISHKMIATRAGLGWIGKTDLFVSLRWGPRVRLASLLLNYPVEATSKAIDESRCGTCMVCVKECPGQTSNGKEWNVNIDRDQFYNAFKCRETCRKLAKEKLNEEITICGICVSVCPEGKKIWKN